ncbi:MAG: 60S ribosomal export protein NMD3 [Candidatus Hadarchaeales archaeon]
MPRSKFCYRCGAEAGPGQLIYGLCVRCFSEENPLIRAPREIKVLVCGSCGAYRSRNSWITPTCGDGVNAAIVDSAISSVQAAVAGPDGVMIVPATQSTDLVLEVHPSPDKKHVRITARGRVHRLQPEVVEDVMIGVRVDTGTCDVCRARRGGKYEAIIQVRGELGGKSISEVRRAVDEAIGGLWPEAFVSKTVKLREGMDFYIYPAGAARRAVQMMRKLGAEVVESSKLVGQTRDGKRRYRSTFLVRF